MQLEFMLHYMIFTGYYIVNDTLRSHVVKALLIWKEKRNGVNKIETLHSNTVRIYVTIYDTYRLLYCK